MMPGQTDDATEILQKSQKTLESLQDFSSNILYVITNPNMPKAIPKTGKVKYKQGKYSLVLSDQEIYCDLEKIWVYLKDNEEVEELSYEPEEGGPLGSVLSVYQANSKAILKGSEVIKGRKCLKIFLTNQDPSLDYNEAQVWIDEETLLLAKATLLDRKKTTTIFEFTNIKTNVGFPDSDFQLTKDEVPAEVIWFKDSD
ncbi:MAG: outer membrane lipoprotein carrier protein LolA [Bacteroidota bacterium]